jgi:NAD(P)-dependent dehydrogenase (short-subunit alcohol dehydrogenase family)
VTRPILCYDGSSGSQGALKKGHGYDPRPLTEQANDSIPHTIISVAERVGATTLEMAPVRVNLIVAGFVDTALSASALGDDLQDRRNELVASLPIHRVVGPADVAALAVHMMTNTALMGATYDIDGGQQII